MEIKGEHVEKWEAINTWHNQRSKEERSKASSGGCWYIEIQSVNRVGKK